MRHLDVFFLHMNIVCVTALGPISLIRFYAPFAVWIAYCLLLNVEWIAIQNYVGLCIYSCSCLMFHTAIKWFDLIFDLIANRDHFVHAPSQREMILQCNFVSHWLGTIMIWKKCASLALYEGNPTVTGRTKACNAERWFLVACTSRWINRQVAGDWGRICAEVTSP